MRESEGEGEEERDTHRKQERKRGREKKSCFVTKAFAVYIAINVTKPHISLE